MRAAVRIRLVLQRDAQPVELELGGELDGKRPGQFAAALDSQPVDDELQPGVHANLAIAVVAEQQADRPAYLDNLLRRHE